MKTIANPTFGKESANYICDDGEVWVLFQKYNGKCFLTHNYNQNKRHLTAEEAIDFTRKYGDDISLEFLERHL